LPLPPPTLSADPTQAPSSRRRWLRNPHAWLILVFILQAAVVLALYGRSPLTGDERDFDLLARNLVHQFRYSLSAAPPLESTGEKSPGYPVLLAGIYALTGDSILIARTFQFILLGGTVVLLYRVAEEVAGRRLALIAAFLCATYPPFVGVSVRLLTEPLAIFLTTLLILLLVRIKRERPLVGWKTFASVGFVMGIAVLVRPSLAGLIIVPGLMALTPPASWRMKFQRMAALAVPFVLLLAPWTLRNIIELRAFAPLGTESGVGLYASAKQYAGGVGSVAEAMHGWVLVGPEDAQRIAAARQKAEQMNVADPGFLAELIYERQCRADAIRIIRSLSARQILTALPLRYLYFAGPSDLGPWINTPFHRVVQLDFLCLVVLVLVGAWMARRWLLTAWLLWLPLVYLALVHTIFHVEARYSLPARPFILILAAVPLSAMASKLAALRGQKHA
jgi:4-amino-4-deoxy-L-arabinose transferase-like glycosyltransferase